MLDLATRKMDAASATSGRTGVAARSLPKLVPSDDRVREAARRLYEASGALAVILFGSRARGSAQEWSDWDLCLVLPDDVELGRVTPFRLRPLTSNIGLPLDVVTIRKSVLLNSIHKHDGLSGEVVRDGKVILGELELV